MPQTLPAPPARTARRRMLGPRGRLALQLGLPTLAGLLLAWKVCSVLLGQNLHVVVPGKVYRGSQPSPAELEQLIRRYRIRTILNLRGTCDSHDWYVAQARIVQRFGINQEDVNFSAVRLPSTSEVRQLLDVLERTEYPIFLHCRHGSDRTGLAAAVVLLLDASVPYDVARGQLGIYYGHLSFGKTGHIDQFLHLYDAWLADSGRTHTPEQFKHWALHEYRGGPCRADVLNVQPIGTLRANWPASFRATVRNPTRHAWHMKPTTTAGIHLYFELRRADGVFIEEGRAGLLERTVAPGETIDIALIATPLPAGRYRIRIDMVEERHCWFFQAGSQPWEGEFEVRE